VRLLAEFAFEQVHAAGPVLRRLRGILRERIATLDDAQFDDAMERGAVIGPVASLFHEEAHVVGRGVGQKFEHERTLRCVDHCLFPRHLRHRVRRGEERRFWRRLSPSTLNPKGDEQQNSDHASG
jgi:hypothetical protein